MSCIGCAMLLYAMLMWVFTCYSTEHHALWILIHCDFTPVTCLRVHMDRYSRAHRPEKIPTVIKKPTISRRTIEPSTSSYDIDMHALRYAIAEKMSRHPQWTLAHIYRTVIEKPELDRRRAAGQVTPHATYVTRTGSNIFYRYINQSTQFQRSQQVVQWLMPSLDGYRQPVEDLTRWLNDEDEVPGGRGGGGRGTRTFLLQKKQGSLPMAQPVPSRASSTAHHQLHSHSHTPPRHSVRVPTPVRVSAPVHLPTPVRVTNLTPTHLRTVRTLTPQADETDDEYLTDEDDDAMEDERRAHADDGDGDGDGDDMEQEHEEGQVV